MKPILAIILRFIEYKIYCRYYLDSVRSLYGFTDLCEAYPNNRINPIPGSSERIRASPTRNAWIL